jgi:hypothetical protein
LSRLIFIGDIPKMPNHITLGSDPEFSIANSEGECVPADRLLSGGNAALGVDGRSDTGELRPNPGDVHQHLMNIRKLVGEFAERFPTHIMLAGSRHFRQPLGGHIHFSGNPVRNPEKLVRALDVHLGLPLLMLENKISARERRQNHDYGHLGQWREQSELHGGFEYRTPSSWLVSMNVAKMTLEVAMLIAYDYKRLLNSSNRTFINPSDDIIRMRYSRAEKTEMFSYNGTMTNLHRMALEAIRKLKKLPNAHQVMNSILTFENAIRLKTRWFHELDCTTRWHLSEPVLKLRQVAWNEHVFDPASMTVFGANSDYACLALAHKVKEELGEVSLERTYYLYGIIDRYGKDLAVSWPFNYSQASVMDYSIADRWYGRAKETAPTTDSILIGVSRTLRSTSRRNETARAITRIIRTIERL